MTTALQFQTIADLCAEVDAAGPRRWLVRGIWPAGSYGVHAAEMKAQKTWNALDLAISVASHTPWLASIPVDDPGPVLIFAGEGGKAAIVRRLRAICASRELLLELLPLVVSTRSPHLNSDDHLNLIAEQLALTKPRLVLLDPLYLAARGAKGSDLYAMGELLERAQHLCEPDDVALLAVTHYNRKEGNGANRITGAGPAEWGRVLIGARVISRHTNPETMATSLLAELDVIGGEVPDQTLRIRREIHSDNPDDLDSPLHYHVQVVPHDTDSAPETSDLAPAARKILQALKELKTPSSWRDIVDAIDARHGHGLKRETVSRNLNKLEKDGLVVCANPDANATETKLWTINTPIVTSVTDPVTSQAEPCDQNGRSQAITTPGDALVTVVTPPIGVTRTGHNPRSHHNDDHRPPENENFWRDDPNPDAVTSSHDLTWAEAQAATLELQHRTGVYGHPIEDVIAEAWRLRGET